MKRFLIISLICTSCVCDVLAENNARPNFFPVENDLRTGHQFVILPFKCIEEESIKWNYKYKNTLNGLRPGSKIKAYTHEGNFVSGTLGLSTCLVGECKANYIALPVTLDDKLDDIKVISRDLAFRIKTVDVIKNKQCKEYPIDLKHPYNFDLTPLQTECHDIYWSGSISNILGESISYGWQQENGINVYHQFFRSVNKSKNPNTIYGALNDVTYSTTKHFPIFGFTLEDNNNFLLWYQKSGLGPVSNFNLRESSIDENSNIIWNSEYTVGGQPCD